MYMHIYIHIHLYTEPPARENVSCPTNISNDRCSINSSNSRYSMNSGNKRTESPRTRLNCLYDNVM